MGDKSSLSATRRQAFAVGAAITASSFAVGGASVSEASPARGDDNVLTTPPDAVAHTQAGSVRGFKRHGVFVFKGVLFGASTGGARRFLPPAPVAPWSGVKLAINYKAVCPQPADDYSNDALVFANDQENQYSSEDCLSLNVWSPALDSGARLPVMVWLHGGGFFSGSSHQLPVYNGENLAKQGVVMVSVNHRLGPLGFMDLSAIGGDGFAKSGNAGMLDLVLALQWVRDNIAAFGGDASRVTIFGHSGGGGKVSTLMAMPDARGLFHRAIVQSGSFPAGGRATDAQALTAATMVELGLSARDVSGFQNVPADRLIAAANVAERKLNERAALGGAMFGPRPFGFGPVVDGAVLPASWQNGAPAISSSVPMIIGNVRDEFRPTDLSVDDANLANTVPPPFRARSSDIIAAVRQAFPGQPPTEVAAIIGGMFMRNLALEQARKQHALGGAPVYSYWYTWHSPVLDGRLGVPHGADLPPTFDNTAICDQFTGNTPEVRAIARVMSAAWVQFAKTGDPSTPGHAWPAYEPERVPTMVFDTTIRMENDPAGTARRLLSM